ncbi:peptidyl-tRNA hydrolase-like [Mercenaria mercenaria]|uniref:peptidyl-tRNA hydrolase-like n=1 Tax=Mercenaria mercenaria TaxID=6596 RepID=UPI001E1E0DFD|nr:peptidyl-tRNA hydrolase-like [Mercenaria mercenaria]
MKPVQIFRSNSSVFQIRHFYVKNYRLREFLSSNSNWSNDPHHCLWFCSRCYQAVRKYSMENKQKETFMIAGLGNHDLPGTRHSVGMQLVNKLARFLTMDLKKNRDCLGFVGEKSLSHIHLVLLKPKQAMNINGASVLKTAKKHNVPVANIYLVHDDLDRKVGKVGLKEKGSAGGHNGVKSVIQSFRTDSIVRVRIGIDRPASIDMVSDYVLQKFRSEERAGIDDAIDQGILKIAQHIGARTGLSAAQIFQIIEDSDKIENCDKSNEGSEVT